MPIQPRRDLFPLGEMVFHVMKSGRFSPDVDTREERDDDCDVAGVLLPVWVEDVVEVSVDEDEFVDVARLSRREMAAG